MAVVNQTKKMPFTPRQMYDLVSDIEKYPEFLPYCTGLVIKSQNARGDKVIKTAEMSIGYKLIKEKITSRILEDPQQFIIKTSLISGPFSNMENSWEFLPSESDGCNVIFSLNYTFSSKMFEAILGNAFDKFFNLFASSFEKRAYEVYGS